MIAAIEAGFPQREIAEASYLYQQQLDSGEKVKVGVNRHVMEEGDEAIEIHRVDREVERRQVERVRAVRAERDEAAVREALDALVAAAQSGENTFPHVLEAVRRMATVGEVCHSLKPVYGEYRETPVF